MQETNPINEWNLGHSQRRPSQLISLETLKPLQKRQDAHSLLFLFVHLGLLGLTGHVLQLTMETPWLVFGLVLHGVLLVHLCPLPWGYWYYLTAIPYFQGMLKNLVRYPQGLFSQLEQFFVSERLRKKVQREAQGALLFYFLLLRGSLLSGSVLLFWHWLFPRILAEPIMCRIQISEHGGPLDC